MIHIKSQTIHKGKSIILDIDAYTVKTNADGTMMLIIPSEIGLCYLLDFFQESIIKQCTMETTYGLCHVLDIKPSGLWFT
jgi:hypothetical protein